MAFKLTDLVNPDTLEQLEESYEKLSEKHIPEGFTLHQLQELEKLREEKLHQLYACPLSLFSNGKKVHPKNRLGRYISGLLATANGNKREVWEKAIALSHLAPTFFKTSVKPPRPEVTVTLKPGEKTNAPAALKKLSSKPVREAAKLAAFAGIEIKYDRKLENVKLSCLCNFSNHAYYPATFFEAARRDREANQTYTEIAKWWEKLSDEDKKDLLSSYIREDGILIEFKPQELSFEKPADRLSKRLKGLKYWKRDDEVIFDGQVWHKPMLKAAQLLTDTIRYSPDKVIQERKQTLKDTLKKTFLPAREVPLRLLTYGFFFKAGRKIIPAGIFSSQFNKEKLMENEEVKAVLEKKRQELKEKLAERQRQFETYYSKAVELIKNRNWTEFWKVAKKTNNKLERMAYYKARKDIT